LVLSEQASIIDKMKPVTPKENNDDPNLKDAKPRFGRRKSLKPSNYSKKKSSMKIGDSLKILNSPKGSEISPLLSSKGSDESSFSGKGVVSSLRNSKNVGGNNLTQLSEDDDVEIILPDNNSSERNNITSEGVLDSEKFKENQLNWDDFYKKDENPSEKLDDNSLPTSNVSSISEKSESPESSSGEIEKSFSDILLQESESIIGEAEEEQSSDLFNTIKRQNKEEIFKLVFSFLPFFSIYFRLNNLLIFHFLHIFKLHLFQW
jgi:hypothetical protein